MKLSVLVPAKNEPHLQATLDDIERHRELGTEVLWMEDPGIGQRKCTTRLAEQASGDYIMKLDAHCSLSQGFDRALLSEMHGNTILAPILMPLDPITWSINGKKQMAQFVFDSNLVMQHADGDAGNTMCLQGSCWIVSKENYFKWNLGDETMPSWGGQGTELGIKAFLNGGQCRTTRTAFYGHVFRHTDADFPYDRGETPGKKANEELVRRYRNTTLLPLVERFGFPCDWRHYLTLQGMI